MTSQPFTTCVGGSARRRLSAPFPCAGSLEQLGQFAHDELALAAMANGLCANSLERSRPATQTDVRAPPARPDTASPRAAFPRPSPHTTMHPRATRDQTAEPVEEIARSLEGARQDRDRPLDVVLCDHVDLERGLAGREFARADPPSPARARHA